jgi:hypothetical protein
VAGALRAAGVAGAGDGGDRMDAPRWVDARDRRVHDHGHGHGNAPPTAPLGR